MGRWVFGDNCSGCCPTAGWRGAGAGSRETSVLGWTSAGEAQERVLPLGVKRKTSARAGRTGQGLWG